MGDDDEDDVELDRGSLEVEIALLSVLPVVLLAVLLVVLNSVFSVVLLVVLEDNGALVDAGALDGLVASSEVGPSVVLGAADEVDEAAELDSAESSDITEVVVDVDKSYGTSGRPTVTAAVANAVVLPSASTSAVAATTTSAFEFVLTTLGSIPVP